MYGIQWGGRRTVRAAGVVVALAVSGGAAQAVQPGFVENFTSGLGGFGGGSQSYSNPGTGGVGGAGDGFLEIGNQFAGRLGGRSTASQYAGDYQADGVHAISFFLKDTGADDELGIYVGVGNRGNFWVAGGFAPAEDVWTKYSVNLFNQAAWTQIIGSGSFDDALANADRILFRHDLPPIFQSPDSLAGDFGVDRIRLIPAPGAAWLALAGLAAAGRRRRG